MHSMLQIRNARICSPPGSGPLRGRADAIISPGLHDLLIEDGRIRSIEARTPASPPRPSHGVPSLDAQGAILIPAFVDCHTHACWAGSRIDEWQLRLSGATYTEILRAGGGIHSTVRAVRAAPQTQLVEELSVRLHSMLHAGTCTVEVKSGYGLSTEAELKMLRAVVEAARAFPGTVRPTALLGHAIDPDQPRDLFVRTVIEETLPQVSREFPGIVVDAYCDDGAWTLEETVALLARAKEMGHPVRVHSDQFANVGMTPAAVRLGARSVDHLESSTDPDFAALAASDAIGVGLPLCGLHLDGRYARLGRLADAGGIVALATNCNPGSAPGFSIPIAMQLAARFCGISPLHALTATTANAAAVLGFDDRGRIDPGCRADLLLLDAADPRVLAYEIGPPNWRAVICNGRVVSGQQPR